MPVNWNWETPNMAVIHVSGKLGKAEFDQVQADNEAAIQNSGGVNVLVVLDNFAGWEAAKGWEDTSFADRNDRYIRKMAFAGEEQWRDMISVFSLQGLRPVPIEYFTSESEARSWLDKTE